MSVLVDGREPNALDLASFYVEHLKYGPGKRKLEGVTADQIAGQLEVLLRDAGVTSITGAELREAADFYHRSLAESFRVPKVLAATMFLDGLMHGIALAGGCAATNPDPAETPA